MGLRVLAALALGAAVYLRFLRRPTLTWGATDQEADARLPGDELLEEADGVATGRSTSTRPGRRLALDRRGPRAARRRLHLRLDREPARPRDAQRRPGPARVPGSQVGDTIGYGSNRMRVERVEPEHVLAWRSEDGNWVWTFVLEERAGSTRLSAATVSACRASPPASG